jgi:hypothetical protein
MLAILLEIQQWRTLILSSELPKFAEVPEEVIIPGEKKCEKCTHYISEHNGPNGHCKHVMYEIKTPEDRVFESMGREVTGARQICPCKEFETNQCKITWNDDETIKHCLKDQDHEGECKFLEGMPE